MNPRERAGTTEPDDSSLAAALCEALQSFLQKPVTIARLERSVADYSTSCKIEELQATLDNGAEYSLVFKDLSLEGQLPEARRVRPGFMRDPRREIAVYQSVLPALALQPPTFVGCVMDHEEGRYWLFREKIQGVELFQIGDFEVWLAASRYLAKMHLRSASLIGELSLRAPLLRYDREFYSVWPQRALRFHQKKAGSRAHQLERIVAHYPAVIERLLEQPCTLLHGDYNASNIIVQVRHESIQVCPVDWELAAIGPGFIDLAALVSGNWHDDERASLLDAYLETRFPGAAGCEKREKLLGDLRYCELHLAMQWLGWSADWQPPGEQRQDWLGRAVRLSGEIGI